MLVRTTDLVATASQHTLEWFDNLRTPALTDLATAVNLLTSLTAVMALRTGGAIVLIVYRRFRLLVVYLATLVIVDWVVTRLL